MTAQGEGDFSRRCLSAGCLRISFWQKYSEGEPRNGARGLAPSCVAAAQRFAAGQSARDQRQRSTCGKSTRSSTPAGTRREQPSISVAAAKTATVPIEPPPSEQMRSPGVRALPSRGPPSAWATKYQGLSLAFSTQTGAAARGAAIIAGRTSTMCLRMCEFCGGHCRRSNQFLSTGLCAVVLRGDTRGARLLLACFHHVQGRQT